MPKSDGSQPLDTNMRKNLFLASLLLAACTAEVGPSPATSTDEAPSGKPLVVTTFYPTEYLVTRIGGDLVEVRCDVPADADALAWMPGDEDILAYQEAELIVLSGAGLESWVEKVSLPGSRTLDCSTLYADELLQFETVTHSHGDGGEHSHEGVDPHTWLDPRMLAQQGRLISSRLAQLLPEEELELRRNWKKLETELLAIDGSLSALGELPSDVRLHANHPAYDYMARRYGWEIENHDLDPEAPLDDHDLEHLVEGLEEGTRNFLLWEDTPLPATVQSLAKAGVTSIVVRPAELLGADERAAGTTLLDIMRANREALAAAFGN